MKAVESASEVAAKLPMSFSVGQLVRVRYGLLAGFSGTLVGLFADGRARIRLLEGAYLETNQSCLGLENAEWRAGLALAVLLPPSSTAIDMRND